MTKTQKAGIARRLEELRAQVLDEDRKPVTQNAFSVYCKLASKSHYRTMRKSFEDGAGDNTSISKILAIADKMDVSLDWLVRGVGMPGLADSAIRDPLYPTRGPALRVHQLMKTDPVALSEVAAISDLKDDPGFQHWLDEIRVHAERRRRRAR